MKPTFAERDNLVKSLVSARVGAKVHQAQIGRRARLSRSFVAQIENGYKTPPPRILRAYADLCGLDEKALCCAWGCVPDAVLRRLIENPALWDVVMAGK